MNPTDLSGFDPRVQNQLAQISLDQQSNTSSRSSRRSASNNSVSNQHHNPYNTYIHPQSMHHPQHRSARSGNVPTPPDFSASALGPDAFPPLGSSRPNPSGNITRGQNFHPQHRGDANVSSYNTPHASHAAQEFFSRARGRGRGRGHRQQSAASYDFNHHTPPQQDQRAYGQYQPRGTYHQYSPNRHRAMDQADYMDFLAQKIMTNMLPKEEIRQKHLFRQKLEALAKTVSESTPFLDEASESLNVRLQSYGSLSNSFGTSGCDVDLLLTVEKEPGDYIQINEKYKRDLEKALLEQGIGARLLTNTRIPIIRVCEKPAAALLDNLWEHRRKRDDSESVDQLPADPSQTDAPLPASVEMPGQDLSTALAELDVNAADVPLPHSPIIDSTKVEFGKDCGIQCDINFTNQVALHNTRMLWTYGQCDVRVRHIGIFVKNWAKARAINSPYHGTLSSYGYVLMVLHYLINVANPPVIPNLQDLAHQDLWGRPPTDFCEDHDVTFTHDLNRVRQYMSTQPRNQSSLGALLFGFFRHYANARDGFNWGQDVISIRSPGGIVSKNDKGWTAAKSTGNVRFRYLIAIEDPFELDHNVGRTVGHNGILAIRGEFRRSWDMLLRIQRAQSPEGISWTWSPQDPSESGDGLDFIQLADDRGDLLRKDADYRREKLRLLKQKQEEDEELAKSQAVKGVSDEDPADTHGMSAGQGNYFLIHTDPEDQAKLIHNVQLQDQKVARMRGPQATLRISTNDEDDLDSERSLNFRLLADVQDQTEVEVTERLVASDSTGLPSNLEAGSDGWATPYEGTSMQLQPHLQRDDQSFVTASERKNNQALWDDWRYVPPTEKTSFNRAESGSNRDSPPGVNQTQWTEDDTSPTAVQNAWDGDINELPQHDIERDDPRPSAAVSDWNNDTFHDNGNDNNQISEPLSPRTKRKLRSSQPLPQSSDAVPQPPQNLSLPKVAPSKSYRQTQRSDAVGNMIQWNRDTMGGRWLLRRDQSIREGKTVELTSGDSGRLNAKFPYDPSMAKHDLVEKNKQLEKYYKTSMYSRQSTDMQIRGSGADTTVIEIQAALQEDSWIDADAKLPSLDVNKIIDAGLIGDGIYWSAFSGIGAWLRWRDRRIIEGVWQPRDSLARLLSELFPRTPRTTVGDMTRMNWEVENFFADLDYPRPQELTHEEMDEKANSIRDAVRKTYEYRASRSDCPVESSQKSWNEPLRRALPSEPEIDRPSTSMPLNWEPSNEIESNSWPHTNVEIIPAEESDKPVTRKVHVKDNEQSKLLLDMFKQEDIVPAKPTRHVLDPKDQNVINERSMQAVKQLSSQLSDPPKEVDVLRARRLAYFQNPGIEEKTPVTVVSTSLPHGKMPELAAAANVDQQDSESEGSCDHHSLLSPSTDLSLPNPTHLNHKNLANLQKILRTSERQDSLSNGDRDFKDPSSPPLSHGSQFYHPAPTNVSANEVIPNTLKPDTWRQRKQWSDRFEDPRVIPIPRTLGYHFDPMHLRDLGNMVKGGNGCAREGQSAFRMEVGWQGYIWGGGGRMGQKSRKGDKESVSDHDEEHCQENKSRGTSVIQRLLSELPGDIAN